MKTYNRLIVAGLSILLLAACEDYQDENFDFSNSLATYVELAPGGTLTGEPGAEVSLTIRMREAINQPVSVDYEVTGDISSSGSITIEKGDISAPIVFSIPLDRQTGTAQVKLTAVDNGLSLGRGGPDAGLSLLSQEIVW